jgi:hypothetical protein
MTKILTRKEVEALDCTWFGGGAVLQDTALALYDVAKAAKALMVWDNNALDISGKDIVTGEPVAVACQEYRDAVSAVLTALAKLPEGE